MLRMQQQSANNNLMSLFTKIEDNFAVLYSSKQRSQGFQGCPCQLEREDRYEEIEHYSAQRQMIMKSAEVLSQRENENERMFGRLLTVMLDYINRILELVRMDKLCACRAKKIEQSNILESKISLLRGENQKYFRLFEEKVLECEELRRALSRTKTSKMTDYGDLRPLSTRNNQPLMQKSFILYNQRLSEDSNSLLNEDSTKEEKQSIGSENANQSMLPLIQSVKPQRKSHLKYFRKPHDQPLSGIENACPSAHKQRSLKSRIFQ